MARPKKEITDAPQVADEVKLVNMKRDPEEYPEPHSALVHPDEVKNYYSGGWQESE